MQGVRSSGFPPFDHDSVTCVVVRLEGAKRVRSSLRRALDHDVLRLRLAAAEEARSAGRPCSRDHSPTVKTAQIAAPTGQMLGAKPHEIKEFGGNSSAKLQLVHYACLYQEPAQGHPRTGRVQENREPAWLSGFEACTPLRAGPVTGRATKSAQSGSVQENGPFMVGETARKATVDTDPSRAGGARGGETSSRLRRAATSRRSPASRVDGRVVATGAPERGEDPADDERSRGRATPRPGCARVSRRLLQGAAVRPASGSSMSAVLANRDDVATGERPFVRALAVDAAPRRSPVPQTRLRHLRGGLRGGPARVRSRPSASPAAALRGVRRGLPERAPRPVGRHLAGPPRDRPRHPASGPSGTRRDSSARVPRQGGGKPHGPHSTHVPRHRLARPGDRRERAAREPSDNLRATVAATCRSGLCDSAARALASPRTAPGGGSRPTLRRAASDHRIEPARVAPRAPLRHPRRGTRARWSPTLRPAVRFARRRRNAAPDGGRRQRVEPPGSRAGDPDLWPAEGSTTPARSPRHGPPPTPRQTRPRVAPDLPRLPRTRSGGGRRPTPPRDSSRCRPPLRRRLARDRRRTARGRIRRRRRGRSRWRPRPSRRGRG